MLSEKDRDAFVATPPAPSDGLIAAVVRYKKALQVITLLCVTLFCASARAQNIEGQPIAAQFGQWQLQGTAPNQFSFSAQSCQLTAGNTNFTPFSQGSLVKIVEPGNTGNNETLTAGLVNIAACSVQLSPTKIHNPPFYLTSGTAGLQEAINAAQGSGLGNTIIINAAWYQQGGTSSTIATVKGSTLIGLVDVTKTPSVWYSWNGSQYVQVAIGGGGTFTPNAIQYGVSATTSRGTTAADVNALIQGLSGACGTAGNVYSPGSSTCVAQSAGGVPSVNNITNPVTIAAGTNVTVSTTGGTITVSTTGSAGSGTVGAAPQYAIGTYPNAGSVATVGGVANTLILPLNLSTSQINAILNTTNVTVTLQAGDAHTPFSNPNNVRVDDKRTDIPVSVRSVKEWGAQCDTRMLNGTTSTSGGITVLNTSGGTLTSNDLGSLVIGVGALAGVPTWFEDPTTSVPSSGTGNFVNGQATATIVSGPIPHVGQSFTVQGNYSGTVSGVSGNVVTLSPVYGGGTGNGFSWGTGNSTLAYALPFDITVQQSLEIGHDDSAGFNAAIAAQLASGGANNISLSLPVGNCLIHHTTQTPQSLLGQSTAFSSLYGFPGEPILNLDGGESQNYEHFTVNVNDFIDSTRPYNYYDTTGVSRAGTVYYQPWGLLTAHANHPCGPGWIVGCSNGAASVTNGSNSFTVAAGETPPAVGSTVIFPYNIAIFSGTVATVAGQVVTLGAGQNYPGTTAAEVEWFAGTSVQTLAAAMPATGHSAKITSFSVTSNVATFQAANAYTAGEVVTLTGFAGNYTGLDGVQVTISATGLSGTQFQGNLNYANGTYYAVGYSGITITVANSIAPQPGFESNVAGHGAIKIGGEECIYSGITRVGTPTITLQYCAQNGTTEAAHAIGSIVVPMNPWKWDSMPWPVTPTVHTNVSETPVGAEYFPAGNVGAYGIGDPLPDGAAGIANGPFHAHFTDLRIQALSRFNNTGVFGVGNDASFFWVGFTYSSHFSHISMYDSSCFLQAGSGIHTHAWNSTNPTNDAMTTDHMNCHANFTGAVLDLISGGLQHHDSWDSYGGTGGQGFNISFGWDDQTGQQATQMYDSVFTDMYEETGGLTPSGEITSELDCLTCQWYNFLIQNSVNIGGQFQQFFGGNFTPDLNIPLMVYGFNTAFHGVLGMGPTYQNNVFGSGEFINWGQGTWGCRDISAVCDSVGVGNTRAPGGGQTNEFGTTGNFTAPYLETVSGLVTPSVLGSWTFDETAPVTHSWTGCGITTSTNCNWVPEFIGKDGSGVFAPGKYSVALSLKQTVGANQTTNFQLIAVQSGQAGAPTCGLPNNTIVGNFTVPLSTSWATQKLGVADLTGGSGCLLKFQYNGVSSTSTTIETSFIDMAPVWEDPSAQAITITGTAPANGSACTNPGTVLSVGGGYIYVCDGGTVHRTAVN